MFKSKKDKIEKELMKDKNIQMKEQEINQETEINIKPEDETQFQEESPETESLQKQCEELRDKLLRTAAEFENYKKRTENEISTVFRYANENLISDLLPVLDDFDRLMSAWDEKQDTEIFQKGIEILYEKFRKILEKQGLKEIPSQGKQFDVNLHDALMMQPTNQNSPGTVLNVVDKGYYLKDRVLRHAKVIVSSPTEDNEHEQGSKDD
jgi:molecular chaperone GrpE